MKRAAVFLDRDGTLNADNGYIYRIEDWQWLPGAMDALRGFKRLGFALIVVSNQAGVAKGLYTDADVQRLHDFVAGDAKEQGVVIDGFYFCPHHPEHGELRACDCRKPHPKLLFQAAEDHQIDLSKSYMIGDKAIDVLAGRAAGVTPILVQTGYGAREKNQVPAGTVVVKDLLEAFRIIENGG